MKGVTLGAVLFLAMAGPVVAQNAAPPAPQVAQPEWRTLLGQATTTFNAEFYKPGDDEKNYKPVFPLLDRAERSATRQFGSGSDPHIAVLHMRAVYLGLAGSYDRQLQVSKQLLKLRTAGADPSSLRYAKALILQTSEITYYNDEHKLYGAQTLLQANRILKALGPVKNDDLADAWYLYAEQMVPFGWERRIRHAVTEDVRQFRMRQEPIDTDDYIAISRMQAGDFASSGHFFHAFFLYKAVLYVAENDSRPEKRHVGLAQLEYGDVLLQRGDPSEAELYLTLAVKTLTKPSSHAWPQQIQYAQNKLSEAKAAKAETLAKAEAARKQAFEGAAVKASQDGRIVATPGLAKILGSLRGMGVDMGKTGAEAK